MDNADGYFIFRRVSKTADGSDGSGYVELEYAGHTYGRTPDEYIESSMSRYATQDKSLIFFKISEAEEHSFTIRKIPEQYELTQHDKVETPITDLRWMNSGY